MCGRRALGKVVPESVSLTNGWIKGRKGAGCGGGTRLTGGGVSKDSKGEGKRGRGRLCLLDAHRRRRGGGLLRTR